MSRGALMRFCKVETYGARIIEYMFFVKKLNKIKTQIFKEVGACSWCYWKTFYERDFLEAIL